MDHPPRSAGQGARPRGWVRAIWYAVVLPLVGAGLLAGGTPASSRIYKRIWFVHHYSHGIFRYRVLGREAVLGLGWVLHTAVRSLAAGGQNNYSLFWANMIVNATVLVAVSMLLYFATAHSPLWRRAYGLLILGMLYAGIIVTPYDYLSYLLIAGAVLMATSRWRWRSTGCFVLAVLGVLTRESFFVAVAASVALLITATPERRREMRRPTVALGIGSVGTYVGLRLALPGGSLFMQDAWLPGNRTLSGLVGCAGAALVVALVYWALSRATAHGDGRRRYRRTTAWTWVLCLPYLVVALVGGLWSEAGRLMLPVLLAGYIVAWSVDQDVEELEVVDEPTG